jgi:peptide/nickel transport system substrate-binding protein
MAGCSRPAQADKVPATLQIGFPGPKRGVPLFRSIYLVHETLVGIGWDGRPTKRLVTDWPSEGRKITLRLRRDVKFHDGTPLDAALVRDLLESAVKQRGEISFKSITRIEAPDAETLVIHLNRTEAFLLADLAAMGITPPGKGDIGAGPFKPTSEDPNRLIAFDQYFRGKPPIDFVEIKEYQEQRSAWAALMRGEINAVHEVNPGTIDFAQTTIQSYAFTKAYYLSLFFNMRHPILGKAAVRQALSQAVDREQIIKLGLNGQGMVADGPIWPYNWAYSTAQKLFTYNAEAATLRLDAAGLPLKKDGGTGQMPSRFRFTCLTLTGDARYEKIAIALQKQLYDVGVEMNIESLTLSDLVERTKKGKFDAFLLERASGRTLATTYSAFHSTVAPRAFQADTGYTSADVTLERLRNSTSDNEIRTAVGDLQRLFYEDPPAIFLAWPKVARAVSTRFIVPDEPGRDVMASLWQWRPDEAAK